ncbi:MAG: hypothetical protein WCL04_02265 [Verrucomicrobiota bacterium]
MADASDTAKIFAGTRFNGDGVITPATASEPALAQLVADIIATQGPVADRSGAPGVDQARIDTFFADCAAYAAWSAAGMTAEVTPLGTGTAAALAAVQAIRAKADDFFARCRLLTFDARAITAVNRPEGEFAALAAHDLSPGLGEIAHFPLAHAAPGRALPLADGVNPAWAGATAALLAHAVTPLFGAGRTSLTAADWATLNARLAPYETWLAGRAGASVAPLGLGRVQSILAGQGREGLAALVAQDVALAPQAAAIANLEKLLRLSRDLRTLLHNFISFADFYSRDRLAVFQAGTLYLDSRSTEFCLRVDGPNPLAAMSKAYIAYCTCTRPGHAPMQIAACLTQGDGDYLFVGRHGIFYDRQGRDWDAVVTSIVDNPISIRQAFFAPYKKFVRMIEEQVAKRAAAADADASARLSDAASLAANADRNAAPKTGKIDIGTVAALGVAVGAIGGALGAVVTGLAKLSPLQLPLVLLGVVALISGPSMLIAWLKLRQRTLGPLLEANGWAINGRVKINLPFGTALTDLAVLPANARRSLEDPYEDKAAAKRRRMVLLAFSALVIAAGWVRWDAVQHADPGGQPRYFWQDRTESAKK